MGVMEARRRILLNQPHLVSASGNPISFSTDMAAKMGVKAHFSPVQSGSGDPSPSNVRPITGWTGCTVSHSGADTSNPTTYPVTFPAVGKNLITGTGYAGELYNSASSDLKKTSERATYTESANTITITCSVGWYGCLFATGVLPAGSYKVHAETASTTMRATVYVTDENLIYTSIVNNYSASFAPTVTLTTPARIAIFIGNSASGSFNVTNLQVESGTSYTAWEPFTNTLYGGYVDAVNGTIEKNLDKILILSSAWQYQSSVHSWFVELSNYPQIALIATGSEDFVGYCNAYPWAENYGRLVNVPLNNHIAVRNDNVSRIYVRTDGTDEVNPGDVEVVLKLATPIQYSLAPQIIKSLKGANTIWSDMNGNLEIGYWKH